MKSSCLTAGRLLIFTLLLSPAWTHAAEGVVQAWVQRYNSPTGPGDTVDQAKKLVIDNSGNVIVAGYTDEGFTKEDFLIIKYSGAGVPLWTNHYNGPGNSSDIASGIALDGSGNVFVTGYSDGGSSSLDYATIKYSGAGIALWTNRHNGPGNSSDQAYAMAVDGSGNVFVTGSSFGTGSFLDYVTVAFSGAGVPLWTNRYNGPGNSEDIAKAIAVDSGGDVFVTGSSRALPLSNPDYATIKYSGAGVPLWTNRYDGPEKSFDIAAAIALDGSGNVFVTGSSGGGSSGSDFATLAYSGAGVPLWTNHYNGPGNSSDVANGIALDGSGNVFVTGYSDGGSSSLDYATIKYSGAGVPLWTNRYNGAGNADDSAQAVAVDDNGNVFVTGSSNGGSSGYDYVTIKYSDGGVVLWTNRYNGLGNGSDYASAVALDASGNVFVTGSSVGNGSDYDYVTIKYSDAGVPLWITRYNGPGNNEDNAKAIAVDGSGNVFVTGNSYGSNLDNYVTIKYSGAGVPLWTNHYNGPGNSTDQISAVAVDGTGNVFVTGSSFGIASSLDYATIKYSGAGIALWTNRHNGPGNSSDQAYAMAVDSSGNVFVTGGSFGLSSSNDYATIKYSAAGVQLWINRYNGPANDSDVASAVAVDGSGNVLVTGSSVGGNSALDYVTIKYSNAGVPVWTHRYDGPGNSYDAAKAIAVDSNGDVIVTGSSDFVHSGYATIKYSSAGAPLWTNRYDGNGNSGDTTTAAVVDGSGNVFVTGYSQGSGSSLDYVTIKYSGAGVPLWTNRYGGPANGPDFGASLAIGPDGAAYVAGSSDGDSTANTIYDFAMIKLISVPLLAIEPDGTGGYFLSFSGVPGKAYRLQRASSVTGPWISSSPRIAPPSGFVEFWDFFPPPGQAFYRTIAP